MPTTVRYLLNDSGLPFITSELQTLLTQLDALADLEREDYRNNNAEIIANHPASNILIVSGPGTGKSTLFKRRINYWLKENETANILAISFVRKLVADLDNDIKNDPNLTDQQKEQTQVFTLHKYARSIVEQNHGTANHIFQAHFKIISDVWTGIVWDDTLSIAEQTNRTEFSYQKFIDQLHNANFETSNEWLLVHESYFKLSKFYNAAGFADLIVHATQAILENPVLVSHQYFIIDEFQDFNEAEEQFIKGLTQTCSGILIVGDDDQLLYDKLKSGKAELIRNLYQNVEFVKAMLPFCGRSSFHITKSAGYFIKQLSDANCIEKIYLPITTASNGEKVQIVGCAASSSAVDYIIKFIEDHEREIEVRKAELENGSKKDPFLLILTPAKELNFYSSSGSNKKLMKVIERYKAEDRKFSEDYYKLLAYYSLANHPENNFTFRKILYYENVTQAEIKTLVRTCINSSINFFNLVDKEIVNIISTKCQKIKTIIDSDASIDDKIQKLSIEVNIADMEGLKRDFSRNNINENQISSMEHQEEESAELEELEIKPMSAVELLTIVGSKGLSADHVIIIGFDDQNMSWISKNAFYVAITRPRKSLQVITALGSGGSQRTSSFLDSLPDEHIELYSYKKTGRLKVLLNNKSHFNSYLESLNAVKAMFRRRS